MKTISNISIMLIIGAIWAGNFTSAQAQMSQYKFNQLFELAFANVVTGDFEPAIPLLERLNKADGSHAQVSFLLAMSYLKSNKETAKAVGLLEAAVERYDSYHQLGHVEDRTAPNKSWFFLAEAYVKIAQYSKAVETYRNYMTTISLSSTQEKRALIAKIKEAQAQQYAVATESGPFAEATY